jgi:hypothetical protein
MQQVISVIRASSIHDRGDWERIRDQLKQLAPLRAAMIDYLVDGLLERHATLTAKVARQEIRLITAMVLDLKIQIGRSKPWPMMRAPRRFLRASALARRPWRRSRRSFCEGAAGASDSLA